MTGLTLRDAVVILSMSFAVGVLVVIGCLWLMSRGGR
jgi:hypothetical protein